jgi:hypothetical protein
LKEFGDGEGEEDWVKPLEEKKPSLLCVNTPLLFLFDFFTQIQETLNKSITHRSSAQFEKGTIGEQRIRSFTICDRLK